ncbi:MAG: NAD-binding protein, partial [Candidatus Sedimenticola sp. 4PFRAG1]
WSTTILDHDPDHIERVREFGYKVYYGDATRRGVLHAAGADKARLLVLAIDDPEAALQVVDQVNKHFPGLKIVARARDLSHAFALKNRGIEVFQREALESGLRLGEETLQQLGFGAYHAKQAAHAFRDHDLELFHDLYEQGAYEKRISMQQQTKNELEKVLSADEEDIENRRKQAWD